MKKAGFSGTIKLAGYFRDALDKTYASKDSISMSTAVATVGTLSKTRSHAAGSPRRHPQLLPHQGTLRSGGSHQRQHQNPPSKGPWLQESRLSAAQGSTHGGHQDRIHRSSEGRLKCGSLRILVQSQKNKQGQTRM